MSRSISLRSRLAAVAVTACGVGPALLFGAGASRAQVAPPSADPVVATAAGVLKARALPDGGAVFKGVPLAQASKGRLRWRPLEPTAAWSGVREAGAFGPPLRPAGSGLE